jgi:hypothetical protein
MRLALLLIVLLLPLTGCPQHPSQEPMAPRLSTKVQLKPNVGEIIRIVGTAHYLRDTGPSVAGDDFEVRVYPRNLWGPEMDGKKVELTGRLEDSKHVTPPDPSLTAGEYWVADAKLKAPEK